MIRFPLGQREAFARRSCSNKEIERDDDSKAGEGLVPGMYCSPSFETATPLLLRMRSNLLKHNNLMLRSERRERLEAWGSKRLTYLS